MASETVTGPGGRLKGWFDRGGWIQAWHAVYLATLVAATILAVTDGDVAVSERLVLGGIAVVAGAWYVGMVRRRYWLAPPARFALAMGVAAALWFPLLVGHPAYGITVFAAYGVAACPWLRRSIAAVAVLTGLVLLAEVVDGGDPLTWTGVAVVVAIAALVLLAHATQGVIAAESERRRRLIVELEATRAELATSERAAGASAERERLARDIHDALAQGFTSIVMLLEAVDARLPAGSAEVRAPLDQALQTARDSLAEVRRIVWALGPDASEPEALVASLERLAERTTAAGGAGVELVLTGEPVRLDVGRELVLLRTAQEAVGNAVRHADASRITVTVTWLGDEVILDVVDDGRGFEPDRAVQHGGDGGFGLANLGRRADEAGGQLTVDSAAGRGTTVNLTLPVREGPVGAGLRGRPR